MSYREYLENNKDLVGMIHLAALPGTPANQLEPGQIIDQALAGAIVYQQAGLGTVMIENMHDLPYAITADIGLAETAATAAFMRADGLIITAAFTGQAPDPEDLHALEDLPVIRLVGSGIEPGNLAAYFDRADVFIVGSSLKQGGVWSNPPQPARVEELLRVFRQLQRSRG